MLVNVVQGVERLEVGQVGEELLHIDQILVGIIEVGQNLLAPAIEGVQRLLHVCLLHIKAVDAANRFDGVGHDDGREAVEQFADGQIRGSPDRRGLFALGILHQVFGEEEARALVGAHDGHLAEVAAEALAQTVGNLLEKSHGK